MFENVHSIWEKREIIAKPKQRVTAAQHRTDGLDTKSYIYPIMSGFHEVFWHGCG